MGFYCQAKVTQNRNRILNATNTRMNDQGLERPVADRLNRVVAELHVDTVSPPPPPRKKTVNFWGFSARIHEKLPK